MPSEDSDQPESLSAQADLSLRWAHTHFVGFVMSWDAQADLSLRWAHTHFVGFVMSRLKLCILLCLPDECLGKNTETLYLFEINTR